MPDLHAALTIAVIALVTAALRFLPFLLFGENRKTPPLVAYLGKVLPFAIMGMLVVYCLKGVNLTAAPFGIPEAIGCAVVACCVRVQHCRGCRADRERNRGSATADKLRTGRNCSPFGNLHLPLPAHNKAHEGDQQPAEERKRVIDKHITLIEYDSTAEALSYFFSEFPEISNSFQNHI